MLFSLDFVEKYDVDVDLTLTHLLVKFAYYLHKINTFKKIICVRSSAKL